MEIVFDYRIEDSEWAKAARLMSDAHSEPLYDAFYGWVMVRSGEQRLLGEEGVFLSVADLAVCLHAIVEDGFPSAVDRASFQSGDGGFEIEMTVERGNVVILQSTLGMIRVEKEEFLSGVARFIREFAVEAQQRIPGVLSWNELSTIAFAAVIPRGLGRDS